MQKISRKNLNSLYVISCDGWKTKISQLLVEQQVNDEIEVQEDLITKAFGESNEKQKTLLKKFFKTSESFVEDIKDFKDVLRLSSKKIEDVVSYNNPQTKAQKSQNALAKIQLISEVYNQGWIPNFTNSNENKYYPYFKKVGSGWVLSGVYYYYCVADFGFGCYFKTNCLAKDAGEKFIDIYNDYLPS